MPGHYQGKGGDKQRSRYARSRNVTHEPLIWTARITAAARAAESVRPNALIVDPWARAFAGARASIDLAKLGGEVTTALVALRTRWIDDVLADGVNHGLAGVVVVGAGFDVRPLRFPMLQRLAWVEIDFAQVFAEKTRVLAQGGAGYPAIHIEGNFLEEPIVQSVRSALASTRELSWVWVLEGVVGYLEPTAVATLFTAIRNLTPSAMALFDLPVRLAPADAGAVLPPFKTTSAQVPDLLPGWKIEGDVFQERRALANEHRLSPTASGAAFYSATTRR